MNDAGTQEMPGTVEEGYDLVKGLIFDQVYKFCNRYGGDMDELVGEAHVAFMKGHKDITRRKGDGRYGAYITEIRRWVWFELFDAMRVRLERERNVTFTSTTDTEDTYVEPSAPTFDRDGFMHVLSEDGQLVAELVLNPPEAVETVAMAKGGTPRNYKSTVRAYLKNDVGWAADRINEAFAEIMGALGR